MLLWDDTTRRYLLTYQLIPQSQYTSRKHRTSSWPKRQHVTSTHGCPRVHMHNSTLIKYIFMKCESDALTKSKTKQNSQIKNLWLVQKHKKSNKNREARGQSESHSRQTEMKTRNQQGRERKRFYLAAGLSFKKNPTRHFEVINSDDWAYLICIRLQCTHLPAAKKWTIPWIIYEQPPSVIFGYAIICVSVMPNIQIKLVFIHTLSSLVVAAIHLYLVFYFGFLILPLT